MGLFFWNHVKYMKRLLSGDIDPLDDTKMLRIAIFLAIWKDWLIGKFKFKAIIEIKK